MAIGQGGYTGDLDEIAAALEGQSDQGKFLENYLRTPATFDAEKTKAQWDVIKQNAKDAGMSVLEWLGETAFKGSQNPEGLGQQALAAVSHPFREANKLTVERGLKGAIPFWNYDPIGALLGVFAGGLGIPVNKYAKGEDVTKLDAIIGGTTLAGPVVGGIAKGTTTLAGNVAKRIPVPKTVDESFDAARRRFLKAAGVTTGLLATGAGGAKILAGKVVAPVAKVTAAATRVSALTTGLATKVFRNLHTMIVQTPSGGYPRTALSRTGDTVLPSPAMADEVGDTLSARMANDLLRPENRNITRFVNRIYNKADETLKREDFLEKDIALKSKTDEFWKNLDEVEGYKAVDDLIGAEEKNLVRIGSENDLRYYQNELRSASRISEIGSSDDLAYVNYHMTKNADLSNEVIKFEQSLSMIDTLARNNPAQLIRILNEVIEEATTNINRVRKGIDQGEGTGFAVKPGHTIKDTETYMLATDKGNISINIGDQRATIKMAQEMLEALK